MKYLYNNILLERGVFIINFLFVIAMILFFYFNYSTKYLFYILIGTTFVLSYLMFYKHKIFSKGIILTNLFVYFYFLYPYIGRLTSELFTSLSTYILILYTLFLAYILLEFSGRKEDVLNSVFNTKITYILLTILIGFVFGIIFYLVGEPIPSSVFTQDSSLPMLIFQIFIISFLIGISEQLLFTGFLYNTYVSMTRPADAQIQTSLLFVAFHMLRIEVIIASFFTVFMQLAYLYLFLYFLALFIFMNISIILYRGLKNIKGSFVYSVVFHTIVDFTLILVIIFL